jgi:hypothetical protein
MGDRPVWPLRRAGAPTGGIVTASPMPPQAACSRCGTRPRAPRQRWCGDCRLAYKREARGTKRGTPRGTLDMTGNGTENGEQPRIADLALPPGVVTPQTAADPKRRHRRGPQLPADWPARFLDFYARHGVRWRSAKYAGIAYDTLVRAEAADPVFAKAVENARQSYLDRHALNLNRLAFKKGNVVASIVALKAGRPAEYVEKAMTVTAHFTTELPAEDGKALLHAMLGQPTTLDHLDAAPDVPGELSP